MACLRETLSWSRRTLISCRLESRLGPDVLELSNASKAFHLPDGHRFEVLRNASMRVGRGEIVAVMGRSGSGKSTLLYGLGLLDLFDNGTYFIDGIDTTGLSDRAASELRGSVFGFVFQQYYLFERRSALANVLLPTQHASKFDTKRATSSATNLLERVGLGHRLSSHPSQLSGGEQQRVAIARSLIRQPRYVFADEPTGSLDRSTGETVLDLLVSICREESCGLVIVTHDETVAMLADNQLYLEDGLMVGRQ